MLKQDLEIVNQLGLHARAASVFVKTAAGFSADVNVRCGERQGNGKSIMSMMMLQATLGSTISLTVEGEDETEALAALAALVTNRFGEAE